MKMAEYAAELRFLAEDCHARYRKAITEERRALQRDDRRLLLRAKKVQEQALFGLAALQQTMNAYAQRHGQTSVNVIGSEEDLIPRLPGHPPKSRAR